MTSLIRFNPFGVVPHVQFFTQGVPDVVRVLAPSGLYYMFEFPYRLYRMLFWSNFLVADSITFLIVRCHSLPRHFAGLACTAVHYAAWWPVRVGKAISGSST
jgi:hypothetical protein